ncbi:HDOD domain-containing protein [Noviherbaspirillum cavernae]|uniref:HDOD domain-containing protein n=1 Tax=Noviherbaspirillum cavernae TaxID=2320862 RepID=A0A418X094_9BURK|nr:HDOD domain-containing protein [Noviherbaspirillum cavernae]RJG05924.1 HDOD domain-containing protein [Noviherbaspirillum cavernae]
MQHENFIVREPLITSQEHVLGFELSWQRNGTGSGRINDTEANALADFVTDRINANEYVGSHDDRLLILAASPATLKAEAYFRLPPQGKVLALWADDLGDPGAVAAIKSLRVQGYGVALRGAQLETVDQSLLSLFSHIEVPVDAPDLAEQLRIYRALGLPSVRMVARNVTSWERYETAASLGMDAFAGTLHLSRRHGDEARDLSPTQTMILRLMDMVKQEAGMNHLEGVLKRDAALSYRLLRYINSAGFGLGCEIQSLKHAVTLMGYSPLYRWLAVLLATSGPTGFSPVLMQTAIIRGRFAELLGETFLPRTEAENLFVAGMFSLLDQLLGIPMEEVLDKIQLSDAVTEALLSREGIYGPFLALAEACELSTTDVESMATSLCISAIQVNDAHMSALAWARNLKL